MKMKLKFVVFYLGAFIALFLLANQDVYAQKGRGNVKGDWIKLGSRVITKSADHDVIEMNKRDGTFTKIKFRITKSRVHVDNIKVVFQNGDVEIFKIDRNFSVGEWSPSFDLVGNKRILDKIIFNYHTKFFADGKGKIIVFGKS